MNRIVSSATVLAALLFLGAGQARAEQIDFSYSWMPQPAVIASGASIITVSAAPDGSAQATLGSSTPITIPGATLTTNSSATSGIPADSFDTTYNMKLHLTDTMSGQSGDLSFSGALKGNLTSTTTTLTSTFNNPLTQMLTLDGRVYSVTIDPTLINLPSPGASKPGLIDALVTVANQSTIVATNTPHDSPEPSTLLLGATAVLGLATRQLLRRQRSRIG